MSWEAGSLTLASCLFAPVSASGSSSICTFYFDNSGAHPAALTGCYYLTPYGTPQGMQAFSLTAGSGVSADFGAPTAAYSVGGVTVYPTGLMRSGVLYAAAEETVALGLAAEPWEGYTLTFSASAGTLAAANTGWTLTMPAEDVVISLLRTPMFATAPTMRLTAGGSSGGYDDEGAENLFDGQDDTKWCCAFNGQNFVEFQTDMPVLPIAYAMTTGDDTASYTGRNPVSWRLLGKRNAEDGWTALTVQTNNGHLPAENCVEVFFPLYGAVACQYYRLEVTAIQGDKTLQLSGFRLVGTPVFGTPAFTLPAALTAIEESAFEDMGAMTVVDAGSATAIGANAFKNCTALTQIRLPADCAIDATAFVGCGTVYVFAPAGGATEAYCQSDTNPCVFVGEAQN